MTCTILQCPPQRTRDVMDEAARAYPHQFWTPIFSRFRRLPRSRKKIITHSCALPGYVFMKGEGLLPPELRRFGVKPMMYPSGLIVTCPMSAVAEFSRNLRNLADRATATAPTPAGIPDVPTFAIGARVQVLPSCGLLSGIVGTVLGADGDHTSIESEDFWGKLKISSFLLQEIEVMAG